MMRVLIWTKSPAVLVPWLALLAFTGRAPSLTGSATIGRKLDL
jgi:hypothetical protein